MSDHELLLKLVDLVTGMAGEVSGIKVDVRALNAKVDQLEARFDKLETKVDRLETKVDRLEATVDAHHIEMMQGFDQLIKHTETAYRLTNERIDSLRIVEMAK